MSARPAARTDAAEQSGDHDSLTKPDVKITSDVATSGYRYLRAPVEIFIVGQTVIP